MSITHPIPSGELPKDPIQTLAKNYDYHVNLPVMIRTSGVMIRTSGMLIRTPGAMIWISGVVYRIISDF